MRLLKKGMRKGSKISTRAKYFPLKKNCEFNRDHPVSSSSSSFEQRGIRTGCTRGRKMCVRLCARCYTSVKSVERKKRKKKKEKRGDTIGKSTYRDVSFILCNARRAAEGETKTGSSGSIMRTDTSRSLSLSLCLSLSRSRSFSRSLVSLIPDSLSSCLSLCSFSVLLSRTLSRSRSRFLSHAVSTTGGKGGDTGNKNSCNIN